MASVKFTSACVLIFVVLVINSAYSFPPLSKRYDAMSGLDFVQICLDNCAQCKRMFGGLFQGQTCAESCIKFNGQSVPDCEDIGSIAPFLNSIQ